jgi:Tol biopolymer transport system component
LFAEGLYDQVCLIQPDGSGMIRLTSNDLADHFYPSLSPEGNSVLFSSNMAGPYEIYEQPLSGLPQRLTVQGENYAPAVSPDGSLVAYTHTDPEGSALWLMNRDGSQPHYLAGMAWDATWSPDGAWILHASDRSGSIQLWRIRPDGSQLTQVTQFDGLRGRNDWSSQGVLATYAGESWQREIITFDQSGENRQQITEGGNNLAPSFSPDGSWMVYTSYVDNYLDDNGCEIYAQHLSSRTRIRLTQNSYCDWQPRWGADPGD